MTLVHPGILADWPICSLYIHVYLKILTSLLTVCTSGNSSWLTNLLTVRTSGNSGWLISLLTVCTSGISDQFAHCIHQTCFLCWHTFCVADLSTSCMFQMFGRDLYFKDFCVAHLFTHQQFSGNVLGLAYIASENQGSAGGICSPSTLSCLCSSTEPAYSCSIASRLQKFCWICLLAT